MILALAPMPTLHFTANLRRHVTCDAIEVPGETVREVLTGAFLIYPQARGYVLDEHGHLRKHVAVFVDGENIRDRVGLADRVGAASSVHIMQALSGG
jgi:molybdopterin converting factor small subunit